MLAQYKKALILEIQSVNTLIAQASALEKEMGDTLHLVSHAKEQLNNYSKSLSLEKTTLSDQITLVEMQLENVSHLRPMLEKGIRMLKSKKNEAIFPVSDSGSNRKVVLPPNKILHELMNALESGIKLFEKKLAAKSSAAVELALLRDAYGNADSPQTLVGIYSEMKKISSGTVTIDDCDKYYNAIIEVISIKLDPVNSKLKASQSSVQSLTENIFDSFRKFTTAGASSNANLSTAGTIEEFKNLSLIFLDNAQRSIKASQNNTGLSR